MLRFIFGDKSKKPDIPANHLRANDVLFILGCKAAEGETETRRKAAPDGRYASYTFKNMVDGKTFELHAEICDGKQKWETRLFAEQVRPGTLAVKELVFDNKPERLSNPKEIYSVLNYIGNNHVRGLFFGSIPRPHIEKGTFGRVGRFMTRIGPRPKSDGFF